MHGPIGVALLNLGGPEHPDDIQAFIRNLLSDQDVMPIPWPIRPLLARWIARRRAPLVTAHYRQIGDGGSPIDELTRAQVTCLGKALGAGYEVRHVFRHSGPRAATVLDDLAAAGVRRLVALPAYPQWSRSTSGSALSDLAGPARRLKMTVREAAAFPDGAGFIKALAALTQPLLIHGAHVTQPLLRRGSHVTQPLLRREAHVLMTAHGLPQRIVDKGDPYVEHVQRTAAALIAALPADTPHSLAYQSRLGPVEWTRPYLTDEIRRLGAAGLRSLVVVPLSFVCENLETRYELDHQIAMLAADCGITDYRRVPTPGCHEAFIGQLADLARHTVHEAGWEVDHGPP